MAFVIRTDKLSKPHYFAGAIEAFFKPSIIVTEIVLNAWTFDDRAEAEKLIADDLGDGWTISTVSAPQVSKNLRRKRA